MAEVDVLNAPGLENSAKVLGRWLSHMMQLHRVLAGGELIGSPTPIHGSIQSNFSMKEGVGLNISPGLRNKLHGFSIISGEVCELPEDAENGVYTARDRFENAASLRARGIYQDSNQSLQGIQLEAFRPDESAGGIIIPGNAIALSTFRVVELAIEPVVG